MTIHISDQDVFLHILHGINFLIYPLVLQGEHEVRPYGVRCELCRGDPCDRPCYGMCDRPLYISNTRLLKRVNTFYLTANSHNINLIYGILDVISHPGQIQSIGFWVISRYDRAAITILCTLGRRYYGVRNFA